MRDGASRYAYAGDSPVSFNDPTGTVRGLCGPNCGDPNAAAGCWTSGTCRGGEGPAGSGSEAFGGNSIIQNGYSWLTSKCGVDWSGFGLSIIFGILGLPPPPNPSLIIGSSSTDLVSVMSAFHDGSWASIVLAVAGLIWDGVTAFVKQISNWFEKGLVYLDLATEGDPAVLGGKLVVMGISAGLSFGALAVDGCL